MVAVSLTGERGDKENFHVLAHVADDSVSLASTSVLSSNTIFEDLECPIDQGQQRDHEWKLLD